MSSLRRLSGSEMNFASSPKRSGRKKRKKNHHFLKRPINWHVCSTMNSTLLKKKKKRKPFSSVANCSKIFKSNTTGSPRKDLAWPVQRAWPELAGAWTLQTGDDSLVAFSLRHWKNSFKWATGHPKWSFFFALPSEALTANSCRRASLLCSECDGGLSFLLISRTDTMDSFFFFFFFFRAAASMTQGH